MRGGVQIGTRSLAAAGAAGLDQLIGAEAERETGRCTVVVRIHPTWIEVLLRAAGPPTGSGPPREARHMTMA